MTAVRTVRLGDVAEVVKGVSYAGKDLGRDGPLMVGMGNIVPGRGLDLAGARAYSGRVRAEQVVADGDIAVALTDLTQDGRLLGAPARLTPSRRGAMVVSHHLATVRPTGAVEPRFLYYLLGSPPWRHYVRAVATGTTVRAVSVSDAARFRFDLPHEGEQRSTAELLGALDDKVDSNDRRAELAEALLDALAASCLDLPTVPLGDLVVVDRTPCTPASFGATLVDHFSLPAFDASRRADRTAGASIKSGKLLITGERVLLSRLNPATDRTWFAVPSGRTVAVASTEFMALAPTAGLGIGALWLALRGEPFRAELGMRATGTSGSHQRVRPDDVASIAVPDLRRAPDALAEEAEGLLRLAHRARSESCVLAEVRDTLLPGLVLGRPVLG